MESGFESYRRERNRRRLDNGTTKLPLGEKSQVLQELEEQEARDARNQQLTREVREFFEDATRQAATIVQKVAEEQEEHAEERLAREMAEFLQDAVQRAQQYIQILSLTSNSREAQKEVHANMQNLVGPLLDGFRHEGTAQLLDKHIGEDPFSGLDEALGGGDDHAGVIEVDVEGDDSDFVESPAGDLQAAAPEPAEEYEPEQALEPAPEPTPPGRAAGRPAAPRAPAASGMSPQAQPRAIEEHPALVDEEAFEVDDEMLGVLSPEDRAVAEGLADWMRGLEVEALKATFKLLVQGGAMSKDDARALYRLEMIARTKAGSPA